MSATIPAVHIAVLQVVSHVKLIRTLATERDNPLAPSHVWNVDPPFCILCYALLKIPQSPLHILSNTLCHEEAYTGRHTNSPFSAGCFEIVFEVYGHPIDKPWTDVYCPDLCLRRLLLLLHIKYLSHN